MKVLNRKLTDYVAGGGTPAAPAPPAATVTNANGTTSVFPLANGGTVIVVAPPSFSASISIGLTTTGKVVGINGSANITIPDGTIITTINPDGSKTINEGDAEIQAKTIRTPGIDKYGASRVQSAQRDVGQTARCAGRAAQPRG